MAEQPLNINSILGGISPAEYIAGDGQYDYGIGIDPDLPISDAVGFRKISGIIRPSGYAKFSGAEVNDNPVAIIRNPKNALVYTILANGKIISYDSSLASETLVGTVSGGFAGGVAYYNNYIYIFTGTDVSRYGPLDGTPALVDNVWTGATLGTQTALVNTTYPSLRGGGRYPNHFAYAHVDNKLYFGDYVNGQGLIHFIKTKKGTSEGDTDDGSTYNALDLTFGFLPTCIEGYGTALSVTAIQTTSATLNQGNAKLFFWDTVSPSFSAASFELDDPLAMALKNVRGDLYIFSGALSNGSDSSNGYRVALYAGGARTEDVYFSNTGSVPTGYAVDSFGRRVVWGTFEQIPTTTAASPEYYAVVMAYGSKDQRLPKATHCIIKATATGTAADGLVTAIKNVQQSSFSYPKFVVGWRDATANGLDSQSTTYSTNVFRKGYQIGKTFEIVRIRVPLSAAISANHTITPKIFFDDYSRSISGSAEGLPVINNTNYADSRRFVEFTPSNAIGKNNFVLEFRWSGTALIPIQTPIEIIVKIYEKD